MQKRFYILTIFFLFIAGIIFFVIFLSFKDAKKSETLRLEAFYQWTKEDPLFASPDLNTKELILAVKRLTEEEDKLLPFFGEEQHFYPVEFLRHFANTAKLTEDFLENPSADKAKSLIQQQEETAKIYAKEAKGLALYLDRVGRNYAKDITFINIQTNVGIIAQDLKLIAKNGEELILEIKKREACLKGNGHCERPAFAFEKPNRTTMVNTEPKTVYDSSMVYYTGDERKRSKAIRGIYKNASVCFGREKDLSLPDRFFYLQETFIESANKPPLSYLDIALADEIYFRRLNKGLPSSKDKALLDSGIEYTKQSATNPYMCPYLGYYAEIATLDYFLQTKQPLIQKYVEEDPSFKEFHKEAQDVEEAFFSSVYPSYKDLSELADYYAYYYFLLTKKQVQDKMTGTFKNELLERSINIKRKLGTFHLIVNYITLYTDAFLQRKDVVADNKPYFYAFRSYYSLTFLPFSSSVYRITETLKYVNKKRVIGVVGYEGNYLTYKQGVERFGINAVKRWFQGSVPWGL